MPSKIEGYLTAVENKNVRTAGVFRSHLKTFNEYNGGLTDKVVEDLKSGTRDYFELVNGYVAFLRAKGTMSNKYVGYSVKTARRFLTFYDIEVTDSKFRLKVHLPKPERRL